MFIRLQYCFCIFFMSLLCFSSLCIYRDRCIFYLSCEVGTLGETLAIIFGAFGFNAVTSYKYSWGFFGHGDVSLGLVFGFVIDRHFGLSASIILDIFMWDLFFFWSFSINDVIDDILVWIIWFFFDVMIICNGMYCGYVIENLFSLL